MGNWSDLVQAKKIPETGDTFKSIDADGLFSVKYDNQNIIQIIMVSDSPVVCPSICYPEMKNAKCICGKYSDNVLDRLKSFITSINDIEDKYTGKHTDFSKLVEVLTTKRKDPYIILDTSDVDVMAAEADDEEYQCFINATDKKMKIIANIDSVISTILARLEKDKGNLTSASSPEAMMGISYFESTSMKNVKEGEIQVDYITSKEGIIAYDSNGKEIGRYDSIGDLRHDIKENPEQFTENTKLAKENNMDGIFDLGSILTESVDSKKCPKCGKEPCECNKEVKESVEPAEKPSANVPEMGPKPDGLKEAPANRPAEQGPSIPAKTEITQDAYNSAIALLMKSFKESTEILATLQNAVITESKKPVISKEALDVFKKFVADKCKSGECKEYTAEDIEKMFTVEKEEKKEEK